MDKETKHMKDQKVDVGKQQSKRNELFVSSPCLFNY